MRPERWLSIQCSRRPVDYKGIGKRILLWRSHVGGLREEDVTRNIEDERVSSGFEGIELKKKVEEMIQQICDQENINVLELKTGSRRRSVSRVRSQLALELVETHGIPLAEVARHVGVSTSAISKMLCR